MSFEFGDELNFGPETAQELAVRMYDSVQDELLASELDGPAAFSTIQSLMGRLSVLSGSAMLIHMVGEAVEAAPTVREKRNVLSAFIRIGILPPDAAQEFAAERGFGGN